MLSWLWGVVVRSRDAFWSKAATIALLVSSNLLLTFAAAARVVHSAAASTHLVTRRTTTADCPGYRASNFVETSTGLTADLTLAGAPCNVYGRDIEHLKLSVNCDTGNGLQSMLNLIH
jgi:hypothetical protein